MGEQKRPKPKKSAVKKRVVKVTKKKSVRRTTRPTIRLAPNIAHIPQPIAVQPVYHPLKRTEKSDQLSLRHHLVSTIVLVIISVISLTIIAGFAQVTFMDIDSLNMPAVSIMKPVSIESRSFPSAAGELTLAMPATWTITSEAENTIQYMHTTETGANVIITVQANDTENIFTWLQTNQPDYINARVVESDPAVTAWRGITVTAETADGIPLNIIYLPIQKNLGERYIVSLRAEVPTTEARLFIDQALNSLLENFGVK